MFFSAIKQLLDEVEHDLMNYQNRGVLSAKAEGWGRQHRHEVLMIHDIMQKPNSIIVLLYIFHPHKQKRSIRLLLRVEDTVN